MEQLSELRNHNQALTRLTKQSLELEPYRAEVKTHSCPNFSALQSYARTLFDTLRSGLRCDCEGHAVKLRLENRNHKTADEDELLKSKPFRVIFTYNQHHAAVTCAAWPWQEADIKWITDKPLRKPVVACSPNTTNSPKATRRVRFDQVQVQKSSSDTLVTATEQQVTITSMPEQIPDLCHAIAKLQLQPRHECAGYLLDCHQRRHGIYPLVALHGQNTQQQWSAFTLREVLKRSAGPSGHWMMCDKFKVAVDLASSVLQLYKTPWLNDDWGDNDVYFVQRPGAPVSSFYKQPFLYRQFSTATGNHCPTAQPPARGVIRNQTLFTLGILLIELLYGEAIEDLQTPRDLDSHGTPGTVWCTADRLIEEEIAFQAGPLYADAVRRCIRCDFNKPSSSLEDQDFQQAVFDGVVAPLEKTLQRFNGPD